MNRNTLMEIAKPKEKTSLMRLLEKPPREESIAIKRALQISKQSPEMMKMAEHTRMMEARNELLDLISHEQFDRLLLEVQNKVCNKGRPQLRSVVNVTISPYDSK